MRSHHRIAFAGLLIVAAVSRPAAGPARDATHRDGTRVVVAGAGTSATPLTTSPSSCSDSAYATYSSKWTQTYRYYVKTSTAPSGVSSDAAVTALRNAGTNIVRGDNACSLSASISASASYQGSTTYSPNITTSGGCGSSDGRNVIDFGTLPSGYLALTCWWTNGSSTVEADMRLNKANYSWVTSTSGCSNKFMIEAVATHEFGHVFGLGHVSEGTHANLTMSPTIYACQNSEASLGLGDVRGMEAKY